MYIYISTSLPPLSLRVWMFSSSLQAAPGLSRRGPARDLRAQGGGGGVPGGGVQRPKGPKGPKP